VHDLGTCLARILGPFEDVEAVRTRRALRVGRARTGFDDRAMRDTGTERTNRGYRKPGAAIPPRHACPAKRVLSRRTRDDVETPNHRATRRTRIGGSRFVEKVPGRGSPAACALRVDRGGTFQVCDAVRD